MNLHSILHHDFHHALEGPTRQAHPQAHLLREALFRGALTVALLTFFIALFIFL
jgi:hypothetical protein